MNWWDYLIIIVSALCTLASMIGAYKSLTYYKKSRQLIIYANTNIAYVETQIIISNFTKILKLSNVKMQRGINYAEKFSNYGEQIRNSISKIRESLPVEYFNEIQALLNTQTLNAEIYIDSIISREVLIDNNIVIDADFNTCQHIFKEIQLLIKKKIDIEGEKLK